MKYQQVKLRDIRKDNRFYIDNEFLNGYAKYVGWQGQVVYVALCRHAKKETSFPSLKHLSTELGVGITSVKEGIKKLKEYNVISVEMRIKTKEGRGSNIYYLLDRSEWKKVNNWSNQGKKSRTFKNIEIRG
jgi:hypothetical protein